MFCMYLGLHLHFVGEIATERATFAKAQPRENPQGIIIPPSTGTSVPHFSIIVQVVNLKMVQIPVCIWVPSTLNQPILIWVWALRLQNGNLQNTESL